MRRSIRMLALTCASVATIALLPASAAASASATPPSLDFGSVPIGTTSAPQSVTLTETCTNFVGPTSCISFVTDVYNVAPVASGDFAESNNLTSPCGSTLQPLTTMSVSCVLDLTFTPSTTGTRTGTLSTGTTGIIPAAGPTVALAGTGTTPPSGTGTSSSPTGTTTGTPAGTNAAKKKCKKKRRAAQAAKKRCKKRK